MLQVAFRRGCIGLHTSSKTPNAAETFESQVTASGEPPQQDPDKAPSILERAIVSRILSEHPITRWTRSEIEIEMRPHTPIAVNEALDHLNRVGVICIDKEELWASQCTSHLDTLEVINI